VSGFRALIGLLWWMCTCICFEFQLLQVHIFVLFRTPLSCYTVHSWNGFIAACLFFSFFLSSQVAFVSLLPYLWQGLAIGYEKKKVHSEVSAVRYTVYYLSNALTQNKDNNSEAYRWVSPCRLLHSLRLRACSCLCMYAGPAQHVQPWGGFSAGANLRHAHFQQSQPSAFRLDRVFEYLLWEAQRKILSWVAHIFYSPSGPYFSPFPFPFTCALLTHIVRCFMTS